MENESLHLEVKNIEFHLKEKSKLYNQCISKAVSTFIQTDQDIDILIKPCNNINEDLKHLMKKYEEYDGRRKKDII